MLEDLREVLIWTGNVRAYMKTVSLHNEFQIILPDDMHDIFLATT